MYIYSLRNITHYLGNTHKEVLEVRPITHAKAGCVYGQAVVFAVPPHTTLFRQMALYSASV